MALDQAETFEYLRQRSVRLDEVEAENARLRELTVMLALRLAKHETKEQVRVLLESENIPQEIWDMQLR